MPTPPITLSLARATVTAVEDALRAGHRPPGMTGDGPGALQVAADTLGLKQGSTVSKRLSAAERAHGLTPDWSLWSAPETPAAPTADAAESEIVRLQSRVSRLTAELKAIHRENLSVEEVRSHIFGLSEMTPEPPEWLLRPGSGPSRAGVPSTIWSDWHIGETVRPEEVNGVNEFDLTIAEQRIARLVERTLDLCFNHMTTPDYPGIVVNLIGDIVSGDIHPELTETNEDELFPIILWAVERIITALKALADQFGRVFVACAPGNHGRMTRKPQAKRYVYKNADWLIYCLIERHFKWAGDDRIRLSIPATGEVAYRVYGHRYMAVHGDDLGVRGGDGIIGALGPICRGELKMRHSQAQIGRDYDTLLMGHWHQTLWLPRAHVNNCLCGYNEYGRRMLRVTASPPAQSLWFTHPAHGITALWSILLETGQPWTDAAWVSWEDVPDEKRMAA